MIYKFDQANDLHVDKLINHLPYQHVNHLPDQTYKSFTLSTF
jgi:hypothetical protein